MLFNRFWCSGPDTDVLEELQSVLAPREGQMVSLALRPDLAEGYELRYDRAAGSAEIRYHKKTDLCRAFLHLYTRCDGESFVLQQSCAFQQLGIMLDCSRNAVPKMDSLKQMIRLAALMGYQFIGLYTEDTIEIEEEPYFGYQRGRWTADEIREADRYAHRFDMELRPYIQTLAHMNQAIRHMEYQAITDANDILLIDDARTEELLDHLLHSVSEMYQTRKLNLGMDEAEMVGLGKYLRLHGYQDRQKLMRRHLDTVLRLCAKYQLKPQIWSDMFFKLAFDGAYYLPEELSEEEIRARMQEIEIPEGLELVYWDYYHQDKAHYDRMTRAHKALTESTAFAGGVWKWHGFAPNNRYSIKCGYQALRSCHESGIADVVLTCWGDNGAEADMFCVLPALFMDAQYAWDMSRPEEADAGDEAMFLALTGYSLQEFLVLDNVNPYIYDGTDHNNACKYFLYNDPLLGTCDSLVLEGTADLYRTATRSLTALAGRKSPFAYLFESEAALSRVLERKADLGLRLKAAYDEDDREELRRIRTELPELAEDLDRFYQVFRSQWNRNNRSFGFEVQTIRIGGLRQRLLDVKCILEDYLDGSIPEIAELEQERLPFDLNPGEADRMQFNIWSRIASTSATCW